MPLVLALADDAGGPCVSARTADMLLFVFPMYALPLTTHVTLYTISGKSLLPYTRASFRVSAASSNLLSGRLLEKTGDPDMIVCYCAPSPLSQLSARKWNLRSRVSSAFSHPFTHGSAPANTTRPTSHMCYVSCFLLAQSATSPRRPSRCSRPSTPRGATLVRR